MFPVGLFLSRIITIFEKTNAILQTRNISPQVGFLEKKRHSYLEMNADQIKNVASEIHFPDKNIVPAILPQQSRQKPSVLASSGDPLPPSPLPTSLLIGLAQPPRYHTRLPPPPC